MSRILSSRSSTLERNGGRGGSDGIGGGGAGGGVGYGEKIGVSVGVVIKFVLGDWLSTRRAMTGHLQLAQSIFPPWGFPYEMSTEGEGENTPNLRKICFKICYLISDVTYGSFPLTSFSSA